MATSTLRPASGQVNSPTSLARIPFRGGFIEAAQLDGTASVLSRRLVGGDRDRSPAARASGLARLWAALSKSRATSDLIELEHAAAFAGT